MGGATSKAARQFPKHSKPTWAGARTPAPPPHPDAKSSLPHASETKTAAIEEDSKDPHLAANLTRLGPVRVDHHSLTRQSTADQVSRTFQSRLQSEQEASSSHTTRNRLVAAALMDLLEERKSVVSQLNGLQGLAEKFNLDVAKLQRVAKYVNSPSVDPESVLRTVNDDGTERTTMKAIWVDSQGNA